MIRFKLDEETIRENLIERDAIQFTINGQVQTSIWILIFLRIKNSLSLSASLSLSLVTNEYPIHMTLNDYLRDVINLTG
jgi:hypothetical protein